MQQLPCCKRRLHDPIDLRVVESFFCSCSNLSQIRVLMPIDSRHQNLCRLCRFPAAAVLGKANPCPHGFKGHGFFVAIRFGLITNSRFDAHKFKASKLTWVLSACIWQAPSFKQSRAACSPRPAAANPANSSGKAANLLVCRSANSRLPMAQSKIEARHRRCRIPAKPGLRCVHQRKATSSAAVRHLPQRGRQG